MAEFLRELFPPGTLHAYWTNMLKDFPAHPLHDSPSKLEWSVPLLLWGDEGNAVGESWMVATWTYGCANYFSGMCGVWVAGTDIFVYTGPRMSRSSLLGVNTPPKTLDLT